MVVGGGGVGEERVSAEVAGAGTGLLAIVGDPSVIVPRGKVFEKTSL